MGTLRISNLTQKVRATAAILMVSSLGLFYPGTVSSVHAQAPTKAPSSPAGGPKEGIKVHGHWTIDIRNPDGKLVSHREFENALVSDGKQSLGAFLGRASKPGEWVIVLGHHSGGELPCLDGEANPAQCVIFEPSTQSATSVEPRGFKNLAIGLQGADTVLNGTATASVNGKISSVMTLLTRCPVASTGVCSSTGPYYEEPFTGFSNKNLGVEINVMAGQIIQVTVVFSFS